jgi:hypothetical protein
VAPLDELLLAEAREAQAAQVHAQAQAELARVRFTEAVRRLHQGGGSMREIARAFGLSHQRVHQIVTGDDRSGRLRCSFCGDDQEAARKLIAGPGVYVCHGCIDLADRMLGGGPREQRRWAARTAGAAASRQRAESGDNCSFCGKSPEQVAAMATGNGFRISRECLDLCQEIIAEELGEA